MKELNLSRPTLADHGIKALSQKFQNFLNNIMIHDTFVC